MCLQRTQSLFSEWSQCSLIPELVCLPCKGLCNVGCGEQGFHSL